MPRIIALDYGTKRTGIAVTDELQMIASGLTTVHTKDLLEFLDNYLEKEKVECIVVGEPKDLKNNPSESAKVIDPFVRHLKKRFKQIKIDRIDERFTSSLAQDAILQGGAKRKKRQNKALVDEVSATIMLQNYMQYKL